MVSDSEALPWLEAVDDEDEPRGVSAGKMLMALVMVLVGVGIVAGTLFYLGREQAGSGPPENLPCWLVFDQTYRDRYLFAGVVGGRPLPKAWLREGAITRAGTLDELATAIGWPGSGASTTPDGAQL